VGGLGRSIGAAAGTPGKRTLTQGLERRNAVQRKAAGTEHVADVHASAAAGVATPAQELPFRDHLEGALGLDLGFVRAHVGGDAEKSATAMGAEAYATGNDVVLGSNASLHTVAHETAHVLQQGGGVQLKGGVGEAGDGHEREADEIAEAVVRGESAANRVAVYPETGADTSKASVQAKTKAAAKGHRLEAIPDEVKLVAEVGTQVGPVPVHLINRNEEPINFIGFEEEVHTHPGEPARPRGDFVVEGSAPGTLIAPGSAMAFGVAFHPQATLPQDQQRVTSRDVNLRALDQDSNAAATIRLRGMAHPTSAATVERQREDRAAAAARSGQVPAPATYEDMRSYLETAKRMIEKDERAQAADLVDAVRRRLDDVATPDLVRDRFRSYGFGAMTAQQSVGAAGDQMTILWRRLQGQASIQPDYYLHAFAQAREPLQLLLGEIDEAPTIRAMHQASPVTIVGTAVAETVTDLFTDAGFAAGFGMGIVEGAYAALRDLFVGAVEMLRSIAEIVGELISGGLLDATILVGRKLGHFFEQIPDALKALGAMFATQWNAEDSFARGEFRGEVIGYVVAQIALLMITAGAAAALQAGGKWAAIVRVLQTADALGDVFTYAGPLAKLAWKLPKVAWKRLRRVEDAAEGLEHAAQRADIEAESLTKHARMESGTDDAGVPDEGSVAKADDQVVGNRAGPYQDPRLDETLPRQHLDRRQLRKVKDLNLKSSWKEAERVLQSQSGVALGRKLRTAEEGHAIMRQLSSGDASALGKLGITDYPTELSTMGREWGLVEARDGFVIYAGKYDVTEVPVDLRLLAHSHPGPTATAEVTRGRLARNLDIPDASTGLRYEEILRDRALAIESGITPSITDIHSISDGVDHVIYTRYVHRGEGKIANPGIGEAAPRVAVHLTGTKVVRWNERLKRYWYEVNVAIRDATGNELWTGKMYGDWWASTRSGTVHFEKPGLLNSPAREAGWREP